MADRDGSEDAPKGSSTGAIIGIVLATLIAGGGGVGLGWMQFGQQQAATHKAGGGKAETEKYADGSRIRDLVPITTNLAGEPAAWIRLEASVVLTAAAEPSEEDDVLLRSIGEDLVAFLRTLSLKQIQGHSGFQNLREDLDERVRIRSEGKAQELVVQAMILE
jgi:flagellar FliL protein